MKNYTQSELIQEFGDVGLSLVSYYKFSFGYEGEKDGKRIYVEVGGNADDIYRFEPLVKAITPLAKLAEDIDFRYASIYENDAKIATYIQP
jgi:hypothetical protein